MTRAGIAIFGEKKPNPRFLQIEKRMLGDVLFRDWRACAHDAVD